MNLASIMSAYLTLNLLVAVAFFLLCGLQKLRRLVRLSSSQLLRLHTVTMLTIVTVSAALIIVPKKPFFTPPAKIWSASSMKPVAASNVANNDGVLQLPSSDGRLSIDVSLLSRLGLTTLMMLLVAGCFYFLRDLRRLLKIQRASHVVRKVGRVEIFVNDEISVPFSFRSLQIANVVIPSHLLSKPCDYRMAIQHELQHHRQGDTKMVYALWFLRLTCVANPFVHLWARDLSEIQEFACDETLVDLKKVDSHAYARCLFEVAQTACGLKQIPVCATGLTFQTKGPLLKRRINTMLFQKKNQIRSHRSYFFTSAAALVTVLTLSAFSSAGLVQDRRVTSDAAERMAANLRGKTEIPIVINDRVLRQLNRFIGTPEGREYMRDALTRMNAERAPIEIAMKRYGVPTELLAMPIIESGYENLPQSHARSAAKGAGLWQFIPQTARDFGLRVDNVIDERLEKPLLTDAAMRLLLANKLRFGSWMLSVSAYNAGEERVQDGITKTGSRDAWVLVGKGFEGDQDYLAKLMAAILIMNNPDSVR